MGQLKICNSYFKTFHSAACSDRLRELDLKYPKDSKFLSKIKLRVADKVKRDLDNIVEEAVQVNI